MTRTKLQQLHINNLENQHQVSRRTTSMELTVKIFFLLIFAATLTIHSCEELVGGTKRGYYKAVQCNGSNKYVYQNISCYAKSYSRSLSTLNIMMTFKSPMNQIFVSLSF